MDEETKDGDDLREIIRSLIVENYEVDSEVLGYETNLYDAGLNSMDYVDLHFKIERRLGLRISREEAFGIDSIDAYVRLILKQA